MCFHMKRERGLWVGRQGERVQMRFWVHLLGGCEGVSLAVCDSEVACMGGGAVLLGGV